MLMKRLKGFDDCRATGDEAFPDACRALTH